MKSESGCHKIQAKEPRSTGIVTNMPAASPIQCQYSSVQLKKFESALMPDMCRLKRFNAGTKVIGESLNPSLNLTCLLRSTALFQAGMID